MGNLSAWETRGGESPSRIRKRPMQAEVRMDGYWHLLLNGIQIRTKKVTLAWPDDLASRTKQGGMVLLVDNLL